MIKTYYSKNQFFNDAIDEYYDNDPDPRWEKLSNPLNFVYICDIDIFHRDKIVDCKIISQIDGIELLGNKKHQYNLMKLYKSDTVGDWIPNTFIFNKNNIYLLKRIFNSNKKYIVKPENSSYRNGVSVVNNYNALYDNVINKSNYDKWILQDYIDDPLLYNGKKFHFRIYALLVRTETSLTVYYYNKGFMYLANHRYNKNKLNNESHLSGESSPDNVRVYPDDFQSYFGDQYIQIINDQFKTIILNTIESVSIYLKSQNDNVKDYKSFKLLGYDILIDKFNKCFLAEINTNQISLKYPPQYFKNELYTQLLNTIHYPNKASEFVKIINIKNNVILRKTLTSDNINNNIYNNTNKNNNSINNSSEEIRKNRIEHFISESEKINNEKLNNNTIHNKHLNMYNLRNLTNEQKYLMYGTIILLCIVLIIIYTTL